MVDAILELVSPKTDWAAIDPEKWGELEAINVPEGESVTIYTNLIFPKGHWEVDDAGFYVWVDDES